MQWIQFIRAAAPGAYVPAGAILLESGDYMSRVVGTPDNADEIFMACWIKKAAFGSQAALAEATNTNLTLWRFMGDDVMNFRQGATERLETTQVFRDPAAWMHVAMQYNSNASGGSGDYHRFWVNGIEVSDYGGADSPTSAGTDCDFNVSGTTLKLFRDVTNNSDNFIGYVADFVCLDGQTEGVDFNISDICTTDNNGNPIPVDPSGLTFGSNGFWLDFADPLDFGKDVSNTSGYGSDLTQSLATSAFSASSDDGSNPAEDAFDDNAAGSAWQSATSPTTEWLKIDLGSGNDRTVEQYTLENNTSWIPANFMPTAWTFQYSDNDSDWTTVDTQSSISWSGNETKTYTFTAAGSHRYWRINITANGGGSKYGINEMQIMQAGGSNSFTPVSITSANSTSDRPMDNSADGVGNFATLNPLSQGGGTTSSNRTFSDGNRMLTVTSSVHARALSTIPFPSNQKTYVEFPIGATADFNGFGVCADDDNHATTPGTASADDYGLYDSTVVTRIYNNSVQLGGSLTPRFDTANTDIGQLCYDGSNGKLWFGVNDTWFDSSGGTTGNPSTDSNATYTLSTSKTWFPYAHGYYSGAGNPETGFDVDFADHTYTVTGSKELATFNLPAPSIADPSAHFQTVTYAGDGNDDRDITFTGNSTFQPDLVWIKDRDNAKSHQVNDSVRGTGKNLSSDSTGVEVTDADRLQAYNSNGFQVGTHTNVNASGADYVAWCWKAGGTASSNTDGTITSSVSANTTAGFSVGTYTGVGSTGTVGHGLTSAPEFIIVKRRDSATGGGWTTWHTSLSTNHSALFLNSTAAVDDGDTNYWNDTAPTSSVFSVKDNGGQLNASTATYVFYTWHSVEGFSKFGSYTGNANADGPNIILGFKPALVMIKKTSATSSWTMHDNARTPYNAISTFLTAETTDADQSGLALDFTSNGFKLRHTGGANSSGDWIYAAFAEMPFDPDGAAQVRAR